MRLLRITDQRTRLSTTTSMAASFATAVMMISSTHAMAADRDIQIIAVHPESQTIEVLNTGLSSIPIDGWRFCSHNTTQVFRYTSPTAFAGVTIEPMGKIVIHLNNDADPAEPMHFNQTDLGFFATFELTAYSLSFYHPNAQGFVSFGDGNLISDHLQWSIDGLDNTTADERSDEAQSGGVWTDQSAWINVQPGTTLIELNDPTYAVLHGPDDYTVIGANLCLPDLNGDGSLNFFDVSAFLQAFGMQDPAADFTNDGSFNFFDVSAFLSAFATGCP